MYENPSCGAEKETETDSKIQFGAIEEAKSWDVM
jgi:hypothetical protein